MPLLPSTSNHASSAIRVFLTIRASLAVFCYLALYAPMALHAVVAENRATPRVFTISPQPTTLPSLTHCATSKNTHQPKTTRLPRAHLDILLGLFSALGAHLGTLHLSCYLKHFHLPQLYSIFFLTDQTVICTKFLNLKKLKGPNCKLKLKSVFCEIFQHT
jgi:hypothetical protein